MARGAPNHCRESILGVGHVAFNEDRQSLTDLMSGTDGMDGRGQWAHRSVNERRYRVHSP